MFLKKVEVKPGLSKTDKYLVKSMAAYIFSLTFCYVSFLKK